MSDDDAEINVQNASCESYFHYNVGRFIRENYDYVVISVALGENTILVVAIGQPSETLYHMRT